jgi:competence protein ComEA
MRTSTFLAALAVAALCIPGGRSLAATTSAPEVGAAAKTRTTHGSARHTRATPTSKLNVNLAEESELAKVPGLGPVRAAAIVAFRSNHKLESLEDLSKVKGIGPKTISKVRPWLVTDGPAQQPLAAASGKTGT